MIYLTLARPSKARGAPTLAPIAATPGMHKVPSANVDQEAEQGASNKMVNTGVNLGNESFLSEIESIGGRRRGGGSTRACVCVCVCVCARGWDFGQLGIRGRRNFALDGPRGHELQRLSAR
jgi:hypothetical protein